MRFLVVHLVDRPSFLELNMQHTMRNGSVYPEVSPYIEEELEREEAAADGKISPGQAQVCSTIVRGYTH